MTARLAVVHEWIDSYAGSEQVFEALAQTYPDADLFALSRRPSISLSLGGRPVRTTVLDRSRLPRAASLPLMPLAWRLLGSAKYDVVLSSHHAFAHTNRLGGVQLCYVHSPARYVWSPEIDGRGSASYLLPARAALQRVDRAAAQRVHSFAANSSAVARRIEQYWGREAVVIPPPVRVEFFGSDLDEPRSGDYVLGVGRFVPYKSLHRVIEVADRVGLPAVIAGRGPDQSRLLAAAATARVPVRIVESPSDAELRALYRNARCLVFPQVEDFGIVCVEALAAGTPVVARRAGGALDIVQDGRAGLLAGESVDELAAAVRVIDEIDRSACVESAQRFSRAAFRSIVQAWVSRAVPGLDVDTPALPDAVRPARRPAERRLGNPPTLAA